MAQVTVKFMVPVYVVVEFNPTGGGWIDKVVVDDEASLDDGEIVEGNKRRAAAAQKVIDHSMNWPAWEFGW